MNEVTSPPATVASVWALTTAGALPKPGESVPAQHSTDASKTENARHFGRIPETFRTPTVNASSCAGVHAGVHWRCRPAALHLHAVHNEGAQVSCGGPHHADLPLHVIFGSASGEDPQQLVWCACRGWGQLSGAISGQVACPCLTMPRPRRPCRCTSHSSRASSSTRTG